MVGESTDENPDGKTRLRGSNLHRKYRGGGGGREGTLGMHLLPSIHTWDRIRKKLG